MGSRRKDSRARVWVRYLRLAWRLRPLAADWSSQVRLLYLGATTLLRSHTRLLSKPVHLRVRLGGAVYKIGLKTKTELNILYEIGIEDEYKLADDVPAAVILDLGASVGLATLRLLASHPQARVIAVEADPELIPRLRANVAGLPVTVVHGAVSGESGEKSFYRSDANSWGNSLEFVDPEMTEVTVPSYSLDDLLGHLELRGVDLLKLDVEGAEWELFEDGPSAHFGAIIGEIHGRPGREPATFVDRLSRSMRVEPISVEPDRMTFMAFAAPTPSA